VPPPVEPPEVPAPVELPEVADRPVEPPLAAPVVSAPVVVLPASVRPPASVELAPLDPEEPLEVEQPSPSASAARDPASARMARVIGPQPSGPIALVKPRPDGVGQDGRAVVDALVRPASRRRCPRAGGGAPGRNRTCCLRLRRPSLYPNELRALGGASLASFSLLGTASRGQPASSLGKTHWLPAHTQPYRVSWTGVIA
jgi:hypothetical protein